MNHKEQIYRVGWWGFVALLGLISCTLFSPKHEREATELLQNTVVSGPLNPPEAVVEDQTGAYLPIPFNTLTVAAQYHVELPADVDPISLSPNGQWLLAHQKNRVCLYAIDSFTEQFCQPWLGGQPSTPTWAPDSQQVAFTENARTYFVESDLWVLSTVDGQLSNLTDDGFDRKITLGEGQGEQVDYAPVFSPDGHQIIFARTLMNDTPGQTTDLYQIAAEGGDTQKLGTLDPKYPFTIYGNLYWTEPSGKVFYSLIRPQASDPQNGVWQIMSTGKPPEQIADNLDDFGPPIVQAVQPRGNQIILAYVYSLFMKLAPPEELIVLFDPTSGTKTPFLAPVEFEVSTAQATFAPDGHTILYLLGGQNQFRLVAYDLATTETKVLLEQNGTLAPSHAPQQLHSPPFSWAENNLVYIPVDGRAPDLLLQLVSVE